MQNELQKAWDGIVKSSADPAAYSLTLKGLAVGAVPALMIVLGFAHVNVGVDQINTVIDSVVNLVQALLTVLAAAMTTIGVLRKLYLSFYPPTGA